MRSTGLACALADFFTENEWYPQLLHLYRTMRCPRVSLVPEILKWFCSSQSFDCCVLPGNFHHYLPVVTRLCSQSAFFLIHSSFSWSWYACSALLAVIVFFIFLGVSVRFSLVLEDILLSIVLFSWEPQSCFLWMFSVLNQGLFMYVRLPISYCLCSVSTTPVLL